MTDSIGIGIQKEAARILKADIVDVVIGFRKGTVPLKARPAFIQRPEAAGRLITDGFCQSNLAVYLTRRPKSERIGMICRGCESRAVHTLVNEGQHADRRLYLIGVPCGGLLDARRIEAEIGGTILTARDGVDHVTAATAEKEHRLPRNRFLHDACLRCR